MLKLSKITKLALTASLGTLFVSGAVFAQQTTGDSGVGIEVSSPLYDYTIAPGKVQQDIIKIKNVGPKEQTFYPEVLDFKSNNQDGSPVFLKQGENSGTYSLAGWISVSKEKITLKPNESAALNFNITVPASAEPGGHYAGILFSTQAPEPKGNEISLASKVGSLLLVRVAGTAKESAKIVSFDSDKNNYPKADVKFTTTVENIGNVHVQPKGVITIKNIFGGQVASVDVNSLSANILPGSTRIFESAWQDLGLKIGPYTATLTLNYGAPAQTLSASTSFWILPWTQIIILLVALIIALVVLYFAIRKYNAWIVSKAKKQTTPQ